MFCPFSGAAFDAFGHDTGSIPSSRAQLGYFFGSYNRALMQLQSQFGAQSAHFRASAHQRILNIRANLMQPAKDVASTLATNAAVASAAASTAIGVNHGRLLTLASAAEQSNESNAKSKQKATKEDLQQPFSGVYAEDKRLVHLCSASHYTCEQSLVFYLVLLTLLLLAFFPSYNPHYFPNLPPYSFLPSRWIDSFTPKNYLWTTVLVVVGPTMLAAVAAFSVNVYRKTKAAKVAAAEASRYLERVCLFAPKYVVRLVPDLPPPDLDVDKSTPYRIVYPYLADPQRFPAGIPPTGWQNQDINLVKAALARAESM